MKKSRKEERKGGKCEGGKEGKGCFLTFLSASKTIGVINPLSVLTATHTSTLLYLK